jgi:hypothetical protein
MAGNVTPSLLGPIDGNARCDSCGRPPRPRRTRLTTVKLTAALPLELALHSLVVLAHPPILLSAVVIAISSTALAVWIVEPAVMRPLGSWLHAPPSPDARIRRAAAPSTAPRGHAGRRS